MPGIQYERIDDIQACRRCGSRFLLVLDVGKECPQCGIIYYARDGDWEREAARAKEERYG